MLADGFQSNSRRHRCVALAVWLFFVVVFFTVVLDELVQVVCHSEKPLTHFSVSGFSPSSMNVCPMKETLLALNLHLLRFSFKTICLALSRTFLTLASCSSSAEPQMRMSSTMIAHGYPSKRRSVACWNTSDAMLMPKGMRGNLYLPYGVLDVVGREDCFSSLICQTPAFAFNVEKTFAFPSLEATSSAWDDVVV